MERTEQQKHMDEIIQKIEEIYQSKNKEGKPTGKSFITHILRAYFPQGKAQRVVDVPDKPMKCAITGQKLFALGEIWNEMHNNPEFFKNMTKSMLIHLDLEAEKVESPFAKVTNGRVVAITGENTDKYLCQDAYEGLFNWYANKILHGDPHINWLIKDMRQKSMIQTVRERLPDTEDQKKIDRAEQLLKHPKRATMNLGDMTALQELQAKLKLQEDEKK
jgi:hypothetical protein